MPTLHRIGNIRLGAVDRSTLAGSIPPAALHRVLAWAADPQDRLAAQWAKVPSAMKKQPRIAWARIEPASRTLVLGWSNGKTFHKDLRAAIAERPMFAPLEDPNVLASVKVLDDGYAVGWPDLDIEFAADALWYETHPQQFPYERAEMTPRQFTGWLTACGFTRAEAARVLGLSRRTVSAYASGEREVPRLVFLACMTLATAARRGTAAA